MRAEGNNILELERSIETYKQRIVELETKINEYESKLSSTKDGGPPAQKIYQIEHTSNPKAVISVTGEILQANNRFQSLIGPINQIIGKPIDSFIPNLSYQRPKTLSQEPESIKFQKQTGLTARTIDKVHLPIEASLAFISTTTDYDIVITLIDISDRIKIEKSLRQTIERLDLSLSGGNIGVWDWDVTNNVLIWDDSMYDLYGIDKAKFNQAYDAWAVTIHPDDSEAAETAVQTALDGGRAFNHEFRIITGSGKVKHIHAKANVLLDEAGNTSRMVGVNHDITKENVTSYRLLNSERQLKAFFDLAPIGLARNDMEGKFIETNSEFERFTGYTTDELNELSYWHLTPQKYDNQEKIQLESLQTKGKYGPYKKEYIHKDGYRFPVLLHGTVIQDMNGIDNIWSTVLDLSEIDNTNKKLSRSLEQLTNSNDELKRFAYVASHDLQEPLRVIMSYLQLVQMNAKDHIDEKSNEYIKRAYEASKRMRTLITDLLSFSRVDQKQLAYTEVNLSDVIDTVLDDLSLTIKQNKAEINVPSDLPSVQADVGQVQRVFLNLLSNAIKFQKPSVTPKVDISFVEHTDEYHIAIKDNGIGIDKKFQKRIFQIFQRLHTSDDYSGTGIGLAIVQKIVNIHNGKIWFESKIGSGSTFTFSLPKNQMNE